MPLAMLFALSLLSAACVEGGNTNTGANTANMNASPAATASVSPAATTGTTIEAREPDKYQAKLTLTLQTSGSGNNLSLPSLTSEVARNGDDHRLSLTLPGGEPVVYLDRADKRYIILPKRKEYVELTPASTGFEVPRQMTAGQAVEFVKNLQGFERVGEESVNGRTAIKYRYTGTSKTGTQAGDVKTEAVVMVDKETGLPLHAETVSEAQGGNVNGVSGVRLVTEMTDIKTDADAKLFEVPQGFNKVSDQQVRQYVDTIGNALLTFGSQLMKSANNNAPSASPSASASPATK